MKIVSLPYAILTSFGTNRIELQISEEGSTELWEVWFEI